MNQIFKDLFSVVKTLTDDTNTVLAFEDAFNSSYTIKMAIDEVQGKVFTKKLDTEAVQSIIDLCTDKYSEEELTKELFYTTLNGFEVDTRFVDVDKLIYILKSIGFSTEKSKYYNCQTGKWFVRDNDLSRQIKKAIDTDKISTDIETSIKLKYPEVQDYIKVLSDFVISQIRDNNQFQEIIFNCVPFEDKSDVQFDKQIMTVISNELFPVIPLSYYNQDMLNDYKEHFPNLDMLLDFILASRFGADRKRAYIWLRAQSNWGKSWLFDGILGELKLTSFVTESDLKLAFSGAPSGLKAYEFTHSWILFIDEFKSAVSEIKNITHKLSFAPKGLGRVTVPVYCKIFASAENVKSLNNDGMVESQFKNRITFWTEQGDLIKRKLYDDNQLEYTRVITTYVFEYLKREAEMYIELGEIEASKLANKKLKEIINLKEVKVKSIEDVLKERIDEFRKVYMNDITLSGSFFEHKGHIYIQQKDKFIEAFLNAYFDKDEHSKIKHKEKDIILDILEPRKSIRLDDETIKGGYLWIRKTTKNKNKIVNTIDFKSTDKCALEMLSIS